MILLVNDLFYVSDSYWKSLEEIWRFFSQQWEKVEPLAVMAAQHTEQSAVVLHKACTVTDSRILCGITGEALFTLDKSGLLCGTPLYGTLSQQECHQEERLQNGEKFISWTNDLPGVCIRLEII